MHDTFLLIIAVFAGYTLRSVQEELVNRKRPYKAFKNVNTHLKDVFCEVKNSQVILEEPAMQLN
jgi:hypothetical protein